MTIFDAKSIAIVGASHEENKVGHKILKNLVSSYAGRVYPINPNVNEILGIKCYPNVKDVPDRVDMAVIAVPSKLVPPTLEDCGIKNVNIAVIISAGFKETGVEGARLEKQCTDIAKKYNMRLVGPNCFGIIDTSSGINTTFASQRPLKGNIGFMSQSGALCAAILDWASAEKVGFSKFISLGNKADLSENDFIRMLYEDPNTKVILAYIEGLKDGREFIRLVRRITREKPVILLKSGRTEAGIRAVASHTGTLAGADNAYSAAFKQCGVLRADSGEELFDYAVAFAYQPVPKGDRVAIVTNAGGPGIMATDACERSGLKLAELNQATLNYLRKNLPSAASIYNPVDVLGDAGADRYSLALEAAVKDPNVDVVIVLLTPQAMTNPQETASIVSEISKKYSKSVLCSFIGGVDASKGVEILKKNGVPNYPYPERAVNALKAMVLYKRISESKYDKPVEYRVDKNTVAGIIKDARGKGRVNLGLEALDILRAYGIPTSKSAIVQSPWGAVKAADKLKFNYPVALKIVSPDIIHKSDIGCVILNVSRGGIESAYNQMIANARRYMPDANISGVLIQEMIPQGHEVILGASKDPQLGPIIMFGLGGIYVELLKDVSFRVAPINRKEAQEMISELKSYQLLKGVRGGKPSDIESLVDSLLRLSQLVIDFPEIIELDVNPIKVFAEGEGCIAIDVRMTLGKEGDAK